MQGTVRKHWPFKLGRTMAVFAYVDKQKGHSYL